MTMTKTTKITQDDFSIWGIYRLAAAVPRLRVADVRGNGEIIAAEYRRAVEAGASAVVFPELSLTGYTCGDLFFQPHLRRAALEEAVRLAEATRGCGAILCCGIPLEYRAAIYNVALVMRDGKILGAVPKSLLPNYREFYEKRQFHSGKNIRGEFIEIGGEQVPFGVDLVFDGGGRFRFSVEICEDLWCVLPPSSQLALAGANTIFNLSAGTELASKAAYRRELVKQQSARCLAAYVLASAGVHESTTDAVFGGHAMIAENGRLAAENRRFNRESSIVYADVDLARLDEARISESSFSDNELPAGTVFRTIPTGQVAGAPDLTYFYNPQQPFVPADPQYRSERCREILDIQCAGLAKRLEHSHSETLVIGISGGLDSTLALLVASECCKLLNRPASDIVTVTMPGFGTTDRTYNNAVTLCRQLGTTLLEIPIADACMQHFDAIGHDPAVRDVTYENVQARERTQILMDLSNQYRGMVVGTGDLSEIALGWSTYNGDHMSMYAVNCSIPKTLIRYLIATVADESAAETAAILRDIIATPVSPELLPPDESGKIQQKTESLIGPYEIHDYLLYHFIKYGAEPAKLALLAKAAFRGKYNEAEIDRNLALFLRRFFQQQFKRSCIPDGPKVGTIALSPRGDWRMPSDAASDLWRE